MRGVIVVVLIGCFCTLGFSQKETLDSTIWIKGIVIDKDSQRPIGNVQLASYYTQQLFTANEEGIFQNDFIVSDSIKIFGLGFDAKVIKIRDIINIDTTIIITLTRKSYLIKSVDVTSKKKLDLHLPSDVKIGKGSDTPPAQRNDNFLEKPPVVAALVSPLSYVNYYTSKSEKRKRAFREELIEYEKQEKINEFYNRDIIKEVSGLENDSLDNFMIYCNVNLNINPKTNHLVVKQMISELYKKYCKIEPNE